MCPAPESLQIKGDVLFLNPMVSKQLNDLRQRFAMRSISPTLHPRTDVIKCAGPGKLGVEEVSELLGHARLQSVCYSASQHEQLRLFSCADLLTPFPW